MRSYLGERVASRSAPSPGARGRHALSLALSCALGPGQCLHPGVLLGAALGHVVGNGQVVVIVKHAVHVVGQGILLGPPLGRNHPALLLPQGVSQDVGHVINCLGQARLSVLLRVSQGHLVVVGQGQGSLHDERGQHLVTSFLLDLHGNLIALLVHRHRGLRHLVLALLTVEVWGHLQMHLCKGSEEQLQCEAESCVQKNTQKIAQRDA